jgi:hypothetical protein
MSADALKLPVCDCCETTALTTSWRISFPDLLRRAL